MEIRQVYNHSKINFYIFYSYIFYSIFCEMNIKKVIEGRGPSFYSFIFLSYNHSPEVTFSGTQKPTPPTVFNLQASDWVHCEEETGAHTGESLWQNYKFVVFFFTSF